MTVRTPNGTPVDVTITGFALAMSRAIAALYAYGDSQQTRDQIAAEFGPVAVLSITPTFEVNFFALLVGEVVVIGAAGVEELPQALTILAGYNGATLPVGPGRVNSVYHDSALLVLQRVNDIIPLAGRRVVMGGHSYGGATAEVAAGMLLEGREVPLAQPEVLTLGAPKPGNLAFANYTANIPRVRLMDEFDTVPWVIPGQGQGGDFFANQVINLTPAWWPYVQTYQGFVLDDEGTPTPGDFPSNDARPTFAVVSDWLLGNTPRSIAEHAVTEYARRLGLTCSRGGVNLVFRANMPLAPLNGGSSPFPGALTMADTFQLTFFFEGTDDGWTEVFYTLTNDYTAAGFLANQYAQKRAVLLNANYSIGEIRVSSVNVFLDSVQATGLPLNGLTAGQPSHPSVAALVRLEAGPNVRRPWYLRGIPQNAISVQPDGSLGFTPTYRAQFNTLAAYLVPSSGNVPFRVRSRERYGATTNPIQVLSSAIVAGGIQFTLAAARPAGWVNGALLIPWHFRNAPQYHKPLQIIAGDATTVTVAMVDPVLPPAPQLTAALRLYNITYPLITAAILERPVTRKVGRPFSAARGRQKKLVRA